MSTRTFYGSYLLVYYKIGTKFDIKKNKYSYESGATNKQNTRFLDMKYITSF